MDQSKRLRRDVDILNGGMDARLNSMFEQVPGIGFVYVDTYGDDRWAEARLAQNLVGDHGAMLGTENKSDFDRFAAWVHWPGIGDGMHRFVYHTQKDVYNSSSIYRGGYSRSVSMMSWQHKTCRQRLTSSARQLGIRKIRTILVTTEILETAEAARILQEKIMRQLRRIRLRTTVRRRA